MQEHLQERSVIRVLIPATGVPRRSCEHEFKTRLHHQNYDGRNHICPSAPIIIKFRIIKKLLIKIFIYN